MEAYEVEQRETKGERLSSVSEYAVFSVVVTYNGYADIRRCLLSLQGSDMPVRIIVVDNASTDGTPDLVRAEFPEATLLRLRKNLGFGRGNNVGIKWAYESGADHVFLLNQDAYVSSTTVRTLVDFQQRNPEFGVLSPLHLDGEARGLDSRFGQHIARSRQASRILDDFLVAGKPAQPIYAVDFVNAAAWMLSRKCIAEVGFFNPVFNHYGEDAEYASRVWWHGFRVGIVLQASICHHRLQDPMGKQLSQSKRLCMERALILFRLSRLTLTSSTNLLSALSRAIYYRGVENQSFGNLVWVKLTLLAFIGKSLLPVLKKRAIARRGHMAYKDAAHVDAARYVCL